MPLSKLGRKIGARKQVVRNLATSLVLYGQITTTEARANTLKPYIERLFSIAKQDTLASRRQLSKLLYDRKAVAKVFEVGLPNLKNISSGFISVFKLPPRHGDGAPMRLVMVGENIFKVTETKTESQARPKNTNTAAPEVERKEGDN